MKPARENPLKSLAEGDEGHKGFQIDTNKFEPKIEINQESDDDDEKGGIRDKAKAVSLLNYSIVSLILLPNSQTWKMPHLTSRLGKPKN